MTQAFVNLGVTQAMSPHINSLVGDLVAMAQAMERVPQLEQELSQIKLQLDNAQFHNQNIELSIIDYKQQIEDLQSKVRSLEVERDDASFRVLESEDLANKALSFAKQAESAAAAIMSLLDPPKAEPEVPQAPETPQGSSESSPTGEQQAGSQEPLPASTMTPSSETVSSAVSQDTAPTTTSEPSNPDAEGAKPLGPYFNKRYYDQANYIPFNEWLAGDGTETDYHWRPSPSYGPSY